MRLFLTHDKPALIPVMGSDAAETLPSHWVLLAGEFVADLCFCQLEIVQFFSPAAV